MTAPSRPFEPTNGVISWIDRQLPIFTVLHGALVAYPTPRNLNYWWSFGSLAGFMLVIQIVTGIRKKVGTGPDSSIARPPAMTQVPWTMPVPHCH